jgi:hypothetical protein
MKGASTPDDVLAASETTDDTDRRQARPEDDLPDNEGRAR